MKTALVTRDGEMIGREYFRAMTDAAIHPAAVVFVGRVKGESDSFERARTGGHWNPPEIPTEVPISRFDRLSDPGFAELLANFDIAIQGSVGIIRSALLAAPRLGWLNVHPGRLPSYRGSSCPEWAVLSGDDVYATAHFLDHGIDTGPVVREDIYRFDRHDTYERFRAGIYPHCANTLVRALIDIDLRGLDAACPQGGQGAAYRNAMPADKLDLLKSMFGQAQS